MQTPSWLSRLLRFLFLRPVVLSRGALHRTKVLLGTQRSPTMAIQAKHKMLVFFIILLTFIAFGAWHSEDMETAYWAMWTVPIIFLGVWLLFDCMFVDEKAFIFDHDYEVGRCGRCAYALCLFWASLRWFQ